MNHSDSAEELDQTGRITEETAGWQTDPGPGSTTGGPAEQSETAARRFVLAGIGALASLCDTAAQQYDQFVTRGQRVQDRWQDRADEVRRQNAGARDRVQDSFRSAMDTFLNSLNIPSKSDVDALNVKLSVLSRKLDDLQTDRMASGGPVPESPPPPPPGDLAT